MPITQQRMLDLIHASDSLLTTYERARTFILEVASSQSNSGGPLAQAREAFTLASPEALADPYIRAGIERLQAARQAILDLLGEQLRPPYDQLTVLVRERTHFEINARRNSANSESLRRRRQTQYDRRDEERAAIYRHNFEESPPASPHSSADVELPPRVAAQLEADQVVIDGIKASPAWHAARKRQLQAEAEAVQESDEEPEPAPELDGRAAYERDRAARRAAEAEADAELDAAIARGERPKLIADEVC